MAKNRGSSNSNSHGCLSCRLFDAKQMKKKSVQVVIGDNPIYLISDPDHQENVLKCLGFFGENVNWILLSNFAMM